VKYNQIPIYWLWPIILSGVCEAAQAKYTQNKMTPVIKILYHFKKLVSYVDVLIKNGKVTNVAIKQ